MIKNQIIQNIVLALFFTFFLVELTFGLERPDAFRASEIIRSRMVIRKYCAPCGDSRWSYVTVKKVTVENSGDDYRVIVNDTDIDLSHLYVNINGNWVNMAILIGLDTHNVPEFLPDKVRVP